MNLHKIVQEQDADLFASEILPIEASLEGIKPKTLSLTFCKEQKAIVFPIGTFQHRQKLVDKIKLEWNSGIFQERQNRECSASTRPVKKCVHIHERSSDEHQMNTR